VKRANLILLVLIVVVQAISALFFVGNILSSLLGFAPIDWQLSEYIEIGAAIGLVLGILSGGLMLRRVLAHSARVEAKLHAASSAFMELIDERFIEWRLTPAERDVALFSIKGMSTQEIAVLRATSEGTVKAQTNAIYRKAGVSGRSQLMSLFIEDLMEAPLASRAGSQSDGVA